MAIVTTVTQVGDRALQIITTGFTTNATAGDEVDIRDYNIYKWAGFPRAVSIQSTRTAGTTDTVATSLQASNVTTVYVTDIASSTASTSSPITEEHENVPPAYYWRHYCTTVGTGNTITLTSLLQFEG